MEKRNWQLVEPESAGVGGPLEPAALVQWMWQGAGQAIRRNRRASRRTRAELAAAAQTEESLIEALELGRGERDLPLSQFFRICAATGYERCLLFSHPRIHIPEPDDDSFWGPIKRLGE